MDEHGIPPEMAEPLPPLDVDRLEREVAGLRLGHPIVYYAAIGSTNTRALELAREGAADGTLVTTDDQTAARGRIGRTWTSLPGQQLALSLILRPVFPRHFLVMASALAVAEAVEVVAGVAAAGIKWPNDVLVGEHKVCGILIESSEEYAILGMGINVNGSLAEDPILAARAMTLEQAAGHMVSREALAAELLQRLDAVYAELQTGEEEAQQSVRDRWRSRLAMLGRRVTVRQNAATLEGMAEDVTEGGALLLRRDDGEIQVITWGDVES